MMREEAALGQGKAAQALSAVLWAAASLFFVLCVVFFGQWEREVLTAADERAFQMAALIIGQLSETLPDAELAIIEALEAGDEECAERGAAILQRYGYSNDQLPRLGQPRPRLMVLPLAALGAVLTALSFFVLEKRRQRERMAQALEAFLSAADGPKHWGLGGRVDELLDQVDHAITLKSARLEEEKERTKALVTDIAHQLKTPIAALKMCFELLAEAKGPAEQAEFLARSHRQIERMEELAASLVNISRLESAMITIKPEPVILDELVLDAVNGVYHRARSKGIALALEDEAPYELLLDRRWTVEALMNVLDNAIKYSPPQSQITISIERLATFVRVAVTDQGPGIPPEEYGRIFQRFYRGQQALVQQTEGSGVGLYLAREILERQGGGLSVRSQVGGGSTFYLKLRLF